jgi:hypothetical protein
LETIVDQVSFQEAIAAVKKVTDGLVA